MFACNFLQVLSVLLMYRVKQKFAVYASNIFFSYLTASFIERCLKNERKKNIKGKHLKISSYCFVIAANFTPLFANCCFLLLLFIFAFTSADIFIFSNYRIILFFSSPFFLIIIFLSSKKNDFVQKKSLRQQNLKKKKNIQLI